MRSTRWSERERSTSIADLGAQMPMRVIGMLLGIPERTRRRSATGPTTGLRTEAGKPMQ